MMGVGAAGIERAALVIAEVAKGVPLRDACAMGGLSLTCFQEALAGDRNLATRYARTRELLADAEVDEALTIADTDTDAQRARNRIDIRKWRATKFNSKVFGERIDLNIQQSISINAARAEALQRTRLLRPVSDQQDIEDARSPSVALPISLDSQSNSTPAAPPVPPEADIFS